ncbi:M24 family metallopeptidase [Nitrososphaera viennensis]|uniref:Aminopeptidase P family protein n=2 Tax=Nitrososphaera viennensis TaxID=1034015 RepID=A0A977IGE2_9ARCH|nr:aminopeptidase P family protein [Nitrososphaera viennensis]UVS70320.1 aminopeptidase P family protein [Nitrososphaera viennensis]
MMMMKERRSRLLQHAAKAGCNAVAAFEPENVFYLTGFWGEAIAVCTDNGTKLVAPKLEYSRAQQSSIDCEVVPTERGSELLATFVSQIKNKQACTDCSDYSTVEHVRRLQGNVVVDTEPFFLTRRIKDEAEMEVIAKASRILDRLYKVCADEIKAGMTERDLQAKLVYEGLKMGANPPSYKSTLNPLIIAGGPNGALPHAEVTGRKFRSKDMIVVDLTLRHQGYIADATRTFALGKPTAEMVRVYEIVQESQKAGLDAAVAGATCGQVDAACRDLIRERGYEKQFIHSTGHGIGLDVHEPPWVRATNEEVLQKNMAVTVEPGIYLEGKFGVRIEDSILVTGGKPKVLNRFTKDLVVL